MGAPTLFRAESFQLHLRLFSPYHPPPGLRGDFCHLLASSLSSFVVSIFSPPPKSQSFHGHTHTKTGTQIWQTFPKVVFDQFVTSFVMDYCHCHSCHHRRPCCHHRPCHHHYHQIFAIVAIVFIFVIAVIIDLFNL